MKAGVPMLERYAQIYPLIADELERALPDDWRESWTSVEMDERQGLVVVYYVGADPVISWIKPPLRLYDRFRDLHNAARQTEPGSVWTSLTYALTRDRKMEVTFGYDPIPIEDEDARHKAWKERFLPRH